MPLKNVSGQSYKATIRTFGSSLVPPSVLSYLEEIKKYIYLSIYAMLVLKGPRGRLVISTESPS